MNFEPLRIAAQLASPIAGDAPMLDAVLERYAFEHNIDGCGSINGGPLQTHMALRYDMLSCVPLEQFVFPQGEKCYCVSSPILSDAYECTEHYANRMDFKRLKNHVSSGDYAKLRQVTGPYAPTFTPHRVRTVKEIVWFARGDREVLSKWLSEVKVLGGKRAAGYGIVTGWAIDTAQDAWLYGGDVLMRPIPFYALKEDAIGWTPYFGAIKPPYWHPERQMEIARPC